MPGQTIARRRKAWGCLVGLGGAMVLILLVALQAARVQFISTSPEGATRQGFTCRPGQPPTHFHVRGTRSTPPGLLVLFTATCPPTVDMVDGQRVVVPKRSVFGYSVMREWGVVWQQSTTNWTGRAGRADPAAVVDFNTGTDDEHTVLYGHVLAADVTQVQVTLSDGRILRDATRDNMFAVVAPVNGICELRAMDRTGQELQRVDATRLTSPMIPNPCNRARK